MAAINDVAAKMPIDKRRVAVFADSETAVLGLALVEAETPNVAGLAMRNPRLRRPPSAVEPGQRRLFAIVPAEDDRMTGLIVQTMEEARQLLTEIPNPDEDAAALVRWVDWMGRE